MTIFREVTKCTKALVNTFVTTFGVADGMHKSLPSQQGNQRLAAHKVTTAARGYLDEYADQLG